MTGRETLFGVPVDLDTMDSAVDRCCRAIGSGRAVQHVALNVNKVVLMEDDSHLKTIVASCEVCHVDGQAVVWAGRLAGVRVPERVAGIDLMEALLRRCETNRWPVYFIGATREVLDAFLGQVGQKYPNLDVVGNQDGYFSDDMQAARAVAASGAKVVFVGMPSPRKEFFLAESLADMGSVFAMGVGGSFDVGAGFTTRAPRWMQRLGLEWFHRLCLEPRRMWKRYLVGGWRFIWLVIREIWRHRFSGTGRSDADMRRHG
jgi:N-acetylglucosaminyldiphosphoundecaprenol N-acetyl-beta-D-mannosaminyltransferase